MRSIAVAAAPVRWRRQARTARNLVDWALARIGEWRRRQRSRAELARLDERMLRDIGVSQADAWRECNKPFWRE